MNRKKSPRHLHNSKKSPNFALAKGTQPDPKGRKNPSSKKMVS